MKEPAFPYPSLAISKCLGFGRCRYNGEMRFDPLIERLKGFADCRPVCPEMEIGLGVPRDPIRIVRDRGQLVLHQPTTGRDMTDAMRAFIDRYFADLPEIDGFILKSGSPSCGPAGVKVYAGFKPGAKILAGAGFFAAAVQARRPGIPVEDEDRLTDSTIRENFLAWIFARARLRAISKPDRNRDIREELYQSIFHPVPPALRKQLGRMKRGGGLIDR